MPASRMSWDEYFMSIAYLTSKRSTCLRRSVGAIIVKDRHICSSGYNGAPSGMDHCLDIGCLREKMNIPSGKNHEICRGVHAEQNAILQAAMHGINIKDSVLYCTTHPCTQCAKMIINVGIRKIYYCENYVDQLAKEIFDQSTVHIEQIDPNRIDIFLRKSHIL